MINRTWVQQNLGSREADRLRDGRGRKGKLALDASANGPLETIGDITATGIDRFSGGAPASWPRAAYQSSW